MAAPARYYQRAKNGFHALQAVIISVGACITIAMFTKGGNSDGRINYYFALCFITIPILVYQTAFPLFPRTKRFSHAYAHAILDIVFIILWFAAFVGEVVWVKDGSHSAKGWKSSDHLCDIFNSDFGTVSKCKLGQGALVLGVIVCLLFALTTAFSIYGVSFYRRNGHLPESSKQTAEPLSGEDVDENNYNFSANPDDRLEGHAPRQDSRPHGRDEDEMSSLHSDPEHGARPQVGRPLSWQRQPTPDLPVDPSFEPLDTSYHGAGAQQEYDPAPPRYSSPPGQTNGRTSNPRYNDFTVHSNESHFVGGLDAGQVPVAGDPFRDDLALSHDHGGYGGGNHLGFPEADYHR